jgi:type VI secretion system secreted protein VgrG
MAKRQLIELTLPVQGSQTFAISFDGEEKVSSLFSFSVLVLSDSKNIDPKEIIGQSITVKINNGPDEPRFFNGLVSRIIKGPLGIRKKRDYIFEFVPWFWFLTLTSDCKIFQNQTVVEVVEAIFQNFGFHDYETSSLRKSYEKKEYCVQYNESAFDFVSRLLEEEGIFYFFRHEEAKHILVLGDSSPSWTYLNPKKITYTKGTVHSDHITSWLHHVKVGAGSYTHTDYNFTTADTPLSTTMQTRLKYDKNSKLEIYTFPGKYLEKGKGQDLSRAHMEEKEAFCEYVSGEGGATNFAVGGKFQLETQESNAEQGDYCIVQVKHKAIDYIYALDLIKENTPQESQNYENSFTVIPSTVPFRPERVTKKPKVIGIQTAIVVGPSGEEIYTDTYGRIKVQFFWDRDGKKDESSSCWVRLGNSLSDKGWGYMNIPRIGQEVIVQFLEGDPDHPVIMGSLYNSINTAPFPLPDQKTVSGFKSRSTPKGGEADFNAFYVDDKKGQELVFVQAQKDYQKTVKNDDKQDIQHDQIVTVKNTRNHTISEGDDTLTIQKGKNSITLSSGDQDITLSKGGRTVSIAGNDQLTISQGNHSIQVKMGKSSLEAMQGIELTVGQNSIKIDQTGVSIQGIMVKINGKMVQVQSDAMLTLKGAITMIN